MMASFSIIKIRNTKYWQYIISDESKQTRVCPCSGLVTIRCEAVLLNIQVSTASNREMPQSHYYFNVSSVLLLLLLPLVKDGPVENTPVTYLENFPDFCFFAAKWIEFQPKSINSHKTPHCSMFLFKTAFYTIEEYFSKYAKLRHHSAQFGQISSRPLSKWKLPTRRWLGSSYL